MTNRLFTRGDESALELSIDGGGSAISTGVKGYIEVPFDCYLEEQKLGGSPSGSIVIDLWLGDWETTPPTVSDSICASAKPTISSGQLDEDSTLTGWTRQFAKGQFIVVNVDSCTTMELATISLKVRKL